MTCPFDTPRRCPFHVSKWRDMLFIVENLCSGEPPYGVEVFVFAGRFPLLPNCDGERSEAVMSAFLEIFLPTFLGIVLGGIITRHYSKKAEEQLLESVEVLLANVDALFIEIRQVLSAIRQTPDLGACLDHDDKGMPIKKAWGAVEVTAVTHIKTEAHKLENEKEKD